MERGMSSIAEVQKEIVSEFSECTDWQERYQLLIEMGDELGSLPDSVKTSERLVPGCQSRVWIVAEEKDGKIEFQADSDSAITRGMIALLIRVFSGRTREEIKSTSLEFLKEIGLDKHLSMSRRNGLYSMVNILRNS
ncbi:Fe-S metabolism associated domain protein [Leptospira borgpetersenii serovar Hardjo-bovis str. Sponselee]|uniref:Fe-S metabolism protein n=3 Tax=Leptospira borgpetersenii TaxID=174 RepID=Q04Q84_LEPBJ|nr:Fe-S metabolism protein [Leptospira borgpetersenii serovar Hardjo-bovis str. JB197]ABJ78205.1 Fe-S metabolism protein [Leptospira borgpetersenii serovar Hardjo-bovis str. L550]EMJ82901.1 Fe-S metabolism associated domain protein [Leptospira borgpetersenii serovar Hardjo-bovis str. Sponselee]EMO62186.1 Fe-S metabolism associated domain protein [Leptospira borgpetersenii serovar Pomona str. 200901868]